MTSQTKWKNTITRLEAKRKQNKLTYKETFDLCKAYVSEAINEYGIDPAWTIDVDDSCTTEGACVQFQPRYLRGTISMDVRFYMLNPEEIREDAYHEVAHIFLNKIHGFLEVLPPEYSEEGHPFQQYYVDAVEETTTRISKYLLKCLDAKNEMQNKKSKQCKREVIWNSQPTRKR